MRLILLIVFVSAFLIRVLLSNEVTYNVNQPVTIEHYLYSTPRISGGVQTFKIQGLKIVTDLVPEYQYGDLLEITGVVEEVTYISNNRQVHYFQLDQPLIIKKSSSNPIINLLGGTRNKILKDIKKMIPTPHSDLLIGILLGDDTGFDKKTKQDFTNTGLLHIVAASGTNVSIVGGFIYLTLLGIVGRKKALAGSIIGIALYSVLAGLSPSIQRAAFMGSISYLGLYLGRQTYALWGLCITGAVLSFINPFIIFDIGFQLSFAATIGILILNPLISRMKLFSKGIIAQDFSVTLSSYLAILPLLLYHFQLFSPFGILANSFILWTIPILTILGGIGSLLLFIHYYVALPIFWLCYPLLAYILWVMRIFSGIFPQLELEKYPSVLLLLGYYLILASLIIKLKK